MAATKYQVLYRYINEATNTAITNSMDNKYETVREFYTDPDHKIFSTDPTAQAEAVEAQQEMISFGNSSENPKTNMLFAYDGTKKIKHKTWVEEATGYVVRDWKRLNRSVIGNEGDFTKDFTTIGAATPEDGGVVICTDAVMRKYFKPMVVISDNGRANAGTSTNPYYTEDKVWDLVEAATPFAITQYSTATSKVVYVNQDRWGDVRTTVYTGPVAIGGNSMQNINGYGGARAYGQTNSNHLFSNVNLTYTNIETTQIPGHYEDAQDSPYLIIDTYKRIQLSPWFVNCTCGSLESAITKARILVDMIGMENVKVIKIVPFDQFVKIK